MTTKRLMSVLLIIFMFMFFGISAFADELSDAQKALVESQKKADQYKGKIDDLEDQILEGNKQVETLNNNITTVNGQINDMQNRITDKEKQIETATNELDAAIADYNQQDERMKSRINAMYKNGTTTGYLEVILESESFADFISRADIMEKVVNYDIGLLKEMKQKREDIDSRKTALEQDKSDLVAMKSDLDNKKATLVAQNATKKNMVALLSRQKNDYMAALKDEEATAAKLKEEVKKLSTYPGRFDGKKWSIIHVADFPNGAKPRITSPFGWRTDPITGVKAYHDGIDIGTALYKNIPVYAMAKGKVIIARYYGGYGNAVVIDHGGGLSTLYGHNNTLLVKEGQIVEGGQKIALSGSTGRSTGPHVHFGVQLNGDYVDATPYLIISQ